MAGTLVANTINTDTGIFTSNNAYLGIAKAWVYFSVSGTTPTVQNSFNVSSITYNGTGDYTATFTTAMPNAYSVGAGFARVSGNGGVIAGVNNTTFTTTTYRFGILNASGGGSDPLYAGVVIFNQG